MSPQQTTQLPDWVPDDHPAREILARYDGKVRGSIEFGLIQRNEMHEVIWTWEVLLATRLIGVGLEDHGHAQLYVASDGRCFGSSEVHDAFYFHAISLRKFLRGKLLGKRSRPMLRPDQPSVYLYGIEFFPGDSKVYFPSGTAETRQAKPWDTTGDKPAS